MDFLKTLLLYMSTTMMMAVQSTSTPAVTPLPTPAPTQAMTEAAPAGPEETPAPLMITATPTATVAITPAPVPSITPNRAYHNLGMGARGAEVKRLQERLIELGYLPEGSADGAYGGKTRNAVRKFQYYNGLTQDGVAGRATQTYLFENPDVMPNPEAVPPAPGEETPAPEPETPAPTEAAETEAPAVGGAETAAPQESAEPAEETPEPAQETAEPQESAAPGNELVENVELDDYEELEGSIVLNESDSALQWTEMEDGVPVIRKPRLQIRGGSIRLSLDDAVQCVDGWRITNDGVTFVLEAAGYTLGLYNEEAGLVATVDGLETEIRQEDFSFAQEGHFIDAEFLADALNGSVDWDSEERTLILRIPEKNTGENLDG